MRKGKQRKLRTPGTNRKVWITGALNFQTGRLHWVTGERKNDELFMKLLDRSAQDLPLPQELHLAVDNDSSHTSKRVEKYVEDSGGRVRLHPLPSWSPESNPVELVWWSLHEAVSRNHECAGLDDLVEFAEAYFEERQPFRFKLGEGLRAVGKAAAMKSGECPFISWSYLASGFSPPGTGRTPSPRKSYV